MGVETWLLVAAVGVLLWAYCRWRHSYWASRGVATPPVVPFMDLMHTFFAGQRWVHMDKVSYEIVEVSAEMCILVVCITYVVITKNFFL